MMRLLIALYSVIFLLMPVIATGQETDTSTNIADFERVRILAILEDEENTLRQADTARLEEIIDELKSLNALYRQIILSQGIAGTTPMVLREFYAHLSTITNRSTDLANTLEDLQGEIEIRLESLSNATQKLTPDDIGVLSPEVAKNYNTYLVKLKELQKALQVQTVQIENELAFAEKIEKKSSTLLKRMEEELPSRWESYFLAGKAPSFSKEFWLRSFSLNHWLSLRIPIWKKRLLTAADDPADKIFYLLTLFVLFSAVGLFIAKHLFLTEAQLPQRPYFIAASAVISSGASIMLTKYYFYPQVTGLIAILGVSIYSFGSMWAAHILRRTFSDYIHPSRTPLTWLFAIGGFTLVAGMPEQMIIPVWLALVLVVTVIMKRRMIPFARKLKKTIWFWALAATVIAAILGYGRLAVLGGMIIFSVYYVYTIGMAGTCLAKYGISHLPDTGIYPFLRALMLGVLSPVIWAISFALAVWWLYDFFGAGVFKATNSFTFSWQGFSLHLISVITVIALFFITRTGIAVVDTYLQRTGKKWPRNKRGTIHSLQSISSYTFWALFALFSLGILGVNLTSITVIAGGLSVGIGFGMQAIFNNFISGLILLFGRSIQQGDIIQIGETWCTVKKINIRTTVVETFENAAIIIPNSELIATQVTNWTKDSSVLRKSLILGVAYGSDTRLVEKTLLEIAKAHPRVLTVPEPWVEFSNFGNSSLEFVMRVWIDDIDYTLRTMSDLRFSVETEFKKLNIEIAFPQMDLHIRSAEGLTPTEAPS